MSRSTPTAWLEAIVVVGHATLKEIREALRAPKAPLSAERPKLRDLAVQFLAGQVLPHSRSMSAGQDQPIKLRHRQIPPTDRRAELRGAGQFLIEPPGFRVCAELAKQHAGEEPRIAGRRAAAALTGKHHLVARLREQPPGNGDLGRIEILIWNWNKHAHRRWRNPD